MKWMERYAAWNEQARSEMTAKGFDPKVWSYYENGQISCLNHQFKSTNRRDFKDGIVTPWKESKHYVELQL